MKNKRHSKKVKMFWKSYAKSFLKTFKNKDIWKIIVIDIILIIILFATVSGFSYLYKDTGKQIQENTNILLMKTEAIQEKYNSGNLDYKDKDLVESVGTIQSIQNLLIEMLIIFGLCFIILLSIFRNWTWKIIKKTKFKWINCLEHFKQYIIYLSTIILVSFILFPLKANSQIGLFIDATIYSVIILFILYNTHISIFNDKTAIKNIVQTFLVSVKNIHKFILIYITSFAIFLAVIFIIRPILENTIPILILGAIIYYLIMLYFASWTKIFIYNSSRSIYEK